MHKIMLKTDNPNSNSISTSDINKYIIELFKWNDSSNAYEYKDDCIMKLNTSTGILEITSSLKNDQSYMLIDIMNDDFSIVSRTKNNIASMYNAFLGTDKTIDYEMQFKNNKFGVRFDSRSSASESNFYEKYDILRTQHRFTDKYASGRIKLEGKKTNKGANGICIEYYDLPNSPIKYVGEFEDGVYDGEGEFYSSDGNIRVLCRNISSGKLTGKGFLRIGRNRESKTLDMKQFIDLKSTDFDYTNSIYLQIEPKYTEMMELLSFESLSLDDKMTYLFTEQQKIKQAQYVSAQKGRSFFNLY